MTTTRHVALLRGLNVGGHRVKMDRLREIFSELGFTDVSTFIASGNVIFSTADADVDELRVRIEAGLAEALGYDVATFLRSPEEIASIAYHEPEGHDDSRALYVSFLRGPADAGTRERLAALESDADRFTYGAREVYWSIRGKMSDSPLFKTGIEKTLDQPVTTRNTTSLRRLAAKLGVA